jgi:8-oxo-dGTP diphosphatase
MSGSTDKQEEPLSTVTGGEPVAPPAADYTYAFPRPALTADQVIFTRAGEQLRVLLIRRAQEPYVGCWALPGGHLNSNETIEAAALRELAEETGIALPGVGILAGVFSAPGRDPRGWVVSVAFALSVEPEILATAVAGDDADEVALFGLDSLPPLAFDHGQIIKAALTVLGLETIKPPDSVHS